MAAQPADISPSGSTAPQLANFDAFYYQHAGRVGLALRVALGDVTLAEAALNEAMGRALQRWKRVGRLDRPDDWVFRVGLDWASSKDSPPEGEATRAVPIDSATSEAPPTHNELQRSIAGLSFDHRCVLVKRCLLDLPGPPTTQTPSAAEDLATRRFGSALDELRSALGVETGSELELAVRLHFTERLRHAQGAAATNIATIRQRATRRAWRTRIIVAASALAAIALAGSVVAAISGPRVEIAARQPTSVPRSPTATPIEPASTTAESHADVLPTAEGQPAAGPTSNRRNQIVSDGNGGFVAIGSRTGDSIVQFIRSTNGATWTWANEWQLPEGDFVDTMRFVDGHFVALVDRVFRVSRGGGLSLDPRIAVSRDLVDWNIIELDLNDGQPAFDDIPRYLIDDIAINDNNVMVVVLTVSSIDHEAVGVDEREVCGGSETDTSTVLTLCDGTLLPIDGPAADRYSNQVRRLMLSRNYAPAVDFTDFDEELNRTDRFGFSGRRLSVYPFGDWFAASWVGPDLERPAGDTSAELLALEARSPTESMTIERVGDEVFSRLADGTGDPAVSAWPAEFAPDPREWPVSQQLTVGPAGWAAVIHRSSVPLAVVERDGWRLVQFGDSVSAMLIAADASELLHYNAQSAELPPAIQLSVFGGARYLRPGTDEVLLELTSDELASRATQPTIAADAVFDRTASTDGWTISGNPLAGPLVLTSPAGAIRTFADGFAFDNDETSDGVETDFSSRTDPAHLLRRARSPLRFFDDNGNLLVEFSARLLYEEMVVPLIGTPDGEGGFTVDTRSAPFVFESWVVFSADGANWRVIWRNDDNDLPFPLSAIVGDDEVLVVSPRDIARIAIDD